MEIMANKQRGFSFSGFLVAIAIIMVAAVVGMKLIPAYMEDAKIKNIFDIITHDPEMRSAQAKDIRMSFAKRASIDGITAVSENDIAIEKNGGGISLSASYSVKIPLAGNVSLIVEFNPSSSK